jgi:hypothetical protein
MSDDDEDGQVVPVGPKCQQCGELTKPVGLISRLGDQPGFQLFECTACRFINWIAEQV